MTPSTGKRIMILHLLCRICTYLNFEILISQEILLFHFTCKLKQLGHTWHRSYANTMNLRRHKISTVTVIFNLWFILKFEDSGVCLALYVDFIIFMI
jgi:hypothetical protein